MPKKRKKVGRTTELTPQVQSELLTMLTTGAYIEHACQAVGIHPATYYNWMNRGQTYKDTLESGEKLVKDDKPFFEFFEAITRARARTSTRVSGLVMKAAEKDWRAAAWWLEQSFPKEWGRKRLEVTGEDGGPVRTVAAVVNVDAGDLDPNDLDQLYSSLLRSGG
jgi:hypothetical protein